MSNLVIETEADLTTIIINRPDVRNAVDGPTADELADAFLTFDQDDTQKIRGKQRPRAICHSQHRAVNESIDQDVIVVHGDGQPRVRGHDPEGDQVVPVSDLPLPNTSSDTLARFPAT